MKVCCCPSARRPGWSTSPTRCLPRTSSAEPRPGGGSAVLSLRDGASGRPWTQASGPPAAIAVRVGGHYLVGPDTACSPSRSRRRLGRGVTHRAGVPPGRGQPTFHGRDVFAPAAAYLPRGSRSSASARWSPPRSVSAARLPPRGRRAGGRSGRRRTALATCSPRSRPRGSRRSPGPAESRWRSPGAAWAGRSTPTPKRGWGAGGHRRSMGRLRSS